jgi:MFS family permease
VVAEPRLGLRANWRQFSLLVAVNAFVGSMVGLERVVVPVLGERVFGLPAGVALLGFVASFGASKALANLAAGRLGDRWGRKPTLLLGWALAPAVPLLLLWAPSWGWVVLANAVLGVSQGLAWSMTVVSKIDLAGPERRGLAMGLNEFAGYLAVGASAWAAWELGQRFGLRTAPFIFGLALALVGLALSLFVRETSGHARHEHRLQGAEAAPLPLREAFARATWRDRDLAACAQAGLVNNLNDGVVWGLLPGLLLAAGAAGGEVGLVAALVPLTWGVAQLGTGAWSDRAGRKPLIVAGLAVQALGLALYLGPGMASWLAASLLLGVGTALVYPTLLGAVGDVAPPGQRSSLVGVYRFWRDAGFVAGALGAGLVAGRAGLGAAFAATAVVTLASGLAVALLLRETLPARRA